MTLSEPLLEVLKIKDFLKQFVEADMVLPRSSKNEDLAEDRRGFHYPPTSRRRKIWQPPSSAGRPCRAYARLLFVACARVKPSITPVDRSLRECSSPHTSDPGGPDIGKNSDGSYRTSRHKEYLAKFCAALAHCLTDQLDSDLRSGGTREVVHAEHTTGFCQWISEARTACEDIRASAQWFPTFRGSRILSLDLFSADAVIRELCN